MVNISLKFQLICCLLYSVHCKLPVKPCNPSARAVVQTVSNGERVLQRLYPWHVAVFKTKRNSNIYICGGSIISKSYILTAAHCLFEGDQEIIDERLYIQTGSNERNRGINYGINKKIVHNDYSTKHYGSDIALLQTLNVITFTKAVIPVCYTSTEFISEDAWIPGWGLTENQTDGPSKNLNHAKMPIRSREVCEARNPIFFEEHINDNTFCAGNLNTTSICSGDSGGGLVIKLNDGWYIRGIASLAAKATSGTFDACDLTDFVLFTDVVSFADWIEENIGQKTQTITETITETIRKRKSEEVCDRYLKERSFIVRGELLNSNNSFREVESAKEFPHYCVIRSSQIPFNRCCGSLISNRWVVTGAKCIYRVPLSDVLLGAYNLLDYNHTGRVTGIEKKHIHEQFTKFSRHYDIALIKLSETVQFSNEIHPACLYSGNIGPAVGTKIFLAGFGNTYPLEPSNVLLQKLQKVSPSKRCLDLYSNLAPDQIICAKGIALSSCTGDHGAPLQLLKSVDKRIFSVVGIASYSSPSCTGDDVYSRISYYLDWIEGHVWPEENDKV